MIHHAQTFALLVLKLFAFWVIVVAFLETAYCLIAPRRKPMYAGCPFIEKQWTLKFMETALPWSDPFLQSKCRDLGVNPDFSTWLRGIGRDTHISEVWDMLRMDHLLVLEVAFDLCRDEVRELEKQWAMPAVTERSK